MEPPNKEWITESAICADVAGVVAGAGEELSSSIQDDTLPSIDLIIESASCAGDAVVAGAFAVPVDIGAGARTGVPRADQSRIDERWSLRSNIRVRHRQRHCG